MTQQKLQKVLGYMFLIGGTIGLLASMGLTIETMKVLQDSAYSPPCNINPIISCQSIMSTNQASVLGFSNTVLGVSGFGALIAFGLTIVAGASFKRWLWWVMQAIATSAVLFVHWLIFQSLYVLGTLCPFCMTVWAVTIPTFWYVTLYNLKASGKLEGKVGSFIYRHHGDILFSWFLLIIGLITIRFWFYWSTLL